MRRRPSPAAAAGRPHRLNVDGFLLPAPGLGTLLLFTCLACRFHARVTCARESAQGLADLMVACHRAAETAP